MNNFNLDYMSRRSFIRRMMLGTSAAALTGQSLLSMRQAVAANSNDYRALVCVFLYGGNDSLNMLVPIDPEAYQVYQSIRQNLAFSRASLLPLNVRSSTPYSLGMPSTMSALQNLFNQQKLAIVSNVGPLLRPVTKAEVYNNINNAPPQLFSHNDQQKHWHSANPATVARSGWAGRMADELQNAGAALPMNLSLDGIQLAQTGLDTIPYSMTAEGPEVAVALDATQNWNRHRVSAFRKILTAGSHPMERGYAQLLERAEQHNMLVADALESDPGNQTDFPANNRLADQLSMVARLIRSHSVLGQQRQIFFVSMGGFDTHDQQASLHPQLLRTLSNALAAFYQELEVSELADSVTIFTQSDFGRTLTSNGDGTDHGWGGHQFVLGGAVNGGNIIGRLPELHLDSDDDLGDGRMIPSIGSDQMMAALATWFGIDANHLPYVLPNIGEFDTLTGMFT